MGIGHRRDRIGAQIADDLVQRPAQLRPRAGGEQRVVAVDRQRVAEITRGRQLAQRVIIHEHRLHKGVEGGAYRVIGKNAGGDALVRALEVVLRGGVILRGVGADKHRGQRAGAQGARRGAEFGVPDGIAIGRIGRAAALQRLGRVEWGGQAALRLDGAGAAVALRLEHRIGRAIAQISGEVAPAFNPGPIAQPGAIDDGAVDHPPVGAAAGGVGIAGQALIVGIGQRGQDRGVAVGVAVEAVGGGRPQPGEILVHHEIDHARHRIGTISGRGSAGQHVHPLDQRCRDEVEIGGGGGGIARHQPSAVDEHQRAPRPQPAQIGRGRAPGAVRQGGGLAGIDLRQGIEDVLHARGAGPLHSAGGDGGDRRGRHRIGRDDSRAGDDDLVGPNISPCWGIVSAGRSRQHGKTQRHRRDTGPDGLCNRDVHVAPRRVDGRQQPAARGRAAWELA